MKKSWKFWKNKKVLCFKGWGFLTKIEKFIGYYRENGERKKFEIDISCSDERKNEISFFEVKWKELKKEEAEKILKEMERNTKAVQKNKKFGIIAKKVENKEEFRREGYKIFDIEDFEKI
jgi:AAA+ ATPase superfamily predicted ATPase